MCDTPEQLSRLDRLEALAIRNTEAIANVTAKIDNLTELMAGFVYLYIVLNSLHHNFMRLYETTK